MILDYLQNVGIELDYVIIAIVLLQLLILVLLLLSHTKYRRMKKNYATFLRGRNGKSLEDSIVTKFAEIDDIGTMARKNNKEIKDIYRSMLAHYQKTGIVKYDAFLEMGGNLSFALALLDQEDDGFIMNVMHSREGCYTYIKEVVKGESFVELSDEESECLERAIFQEEYALRAK